MLIASGGQHTSDAEVQRYKPIASRKRSPRDICYELHLIQVGAQSPLYKVFAVLERRLLALI